MPARKAGVLAMPVEAALEVTPVAVSAVQEAAVAMQTELQQRQWRASVRQTNSKPAI